MANLSPFPKMYFTGSDGLPLVGGKLYSYAGGTSTPKDTYTDSTGVTPNTNPIILNSRGEASVWLETGKYKFTLKDSNDVDIWTVDNISQAFESENISIIDSGGYYVGSNVEAALQESAVFVQSGSGAITRTKTEKMRDFISVKDFGALGNGSRDDTADIQAAINAADATGTNLFFPAGTYIVSSTGLLIDGTSAGTVGFYGAGMDATIIKNASGNVLRIKGEKASFSDMTFWSAGGGDTITQTGILAQANFDRVTVIQEGNGYSLFSNATHEYIEVRWTNCMLQHKTTATVPGFNLVSAGGDINDNVWQDCRALYSGNYFFWIESTGTNWQYHNQFKNINFEVCTGGGIKLISNINYEISNCANWDAQLVGPILKDFYDMTANASSYTCIGKIYNCGRWAGVNDTGIYDIDLPNSGLGGGTIIENCRAASAGADAFEANLRDGSTILIGNPSTFAASNTAGARWLSDDGFAFGDATGANTLDDYEEGTFTPVVIGVTSAGTGTYTAQVGRYTKIGNRVFFSITLGWSAHSGTGNTRITGLPFTTNATAGNNPAIATYCDGLTLNANSLLMATMPAAQTYINLLQNTTGGGSAAFVAIDASVTTVSLAGHYEV
jgi:hypothetical protein